MGGLLASLPAQLPAGAGYRWKDLGKTAFDNCFLHHLLVGMHVSPHICSPSMPPCRRYDIEDAIVMNRASLDRGFGRCIVLRKYGTSLKKYANRTQDRIVLPAAAVGPASAPRPAKFRVLDRDGIAAAGEVLTQGEKGRHGMIRWAWHGARCRAGAGCAGMHERWLVCAVLLSPCCAALCPPCRRDPGEQADAHQHARPCVQPGSHAGYLLPQCACLLEGVHRRREVCGGQGGMSCSWASQFW